MDRWHFGYVRRCTVFIASLCKFQVSRSWLWKCSEMNRNWWLPGRYSRKINLKLLDKTANSCIHTFFFVWTTESTPITPKPQFFKIKQFCNNNPASPASKQPPHITFKYCMRQSLSYLILPRYCREFSRLMIESMDTHTNAEAHLELKVWDRMLTRKVTGRGGRKTEDKRGMEDTEIWLITFVILPGRKQT